MDGNRFNELVAADALELVERGCMRHDKTVGGVRIIIDPSWLAGNRLDKMYERLFGGEPTERQWASWLADAVEESDEAQEMIYRVAKLRAAEIWERKHAD